MGWVQVLLIAAGVVAALVVGASLALRKIREDFLFEVGGSSGSPHRMGVRDPAAISAEDRWPSRDTTPPGEAMPEGQIPAPGEDWTDKEAVVLAREAAAGLKGVQALCKRAARINDDAMKQVATAMVEHVAAQVANSLRSTPIAEMQALTSVQGVRLSALGSAGYTSVAQVLTAGPDRLEKIPGIGEITAKRIMQAAGESRELAYQRSRYGLKQSDPSPEQDELLQNVWNVVALRKGISIPPSDLTRQVRSARRLSRALVLPGYRVTWLLLLPGRKREWQWRVHAAKVQLEATQHGEILRQAQLLVDNDGLTPAARSLWPWVAANPESAKEGLNLAVACAFDRTRVGKYESRSGRSAPQGSLATAISRRLAVTSIPRSGLVTSPSQQSGVDDTTALYRLYDIHGRLLYVGISNRVHHRIRSHRMDKQWGAHIAQTKIEYFTTRVGALSAEEAAIKRERPRHNVIHNS